MAVVPLPSPAVCVCVCCLAQGWCHVFVSLSPQCVWPVFTVAPPARLHLLQAFLIVLTRRNAWIRCSHSRTFAADKLKQTLAHFSVEILNHREGVSLFISRFRWQLCFQTPEAKQRNYTVFRMPLHTHTHTHTRRAFSSD